MKTQFDMFTSDDPAQNVAKIIAFTSQGKQQFIQFVSHLVDFHPINAIYFQLLRDIDKHFTDRMIVEFWNEGYWNGAIEDLDDNEQGPGLMTDIYRFISKTKQAA